MTTGSRLEHLVWRAARSRRAVAATAAVLLGLCFVVSLIIGTPREPAIIAYGVPVALVGMALGARAGAAAAFVGAGLYWLGTYHDGHPLSAGQISYRLGALVFLGVVVGALSSRLAETEHRAQLQRELHSRAVELNDTVVQGLALSRYQLTADDSTAAFATLTATLERAQELVNDLMGEVELEPGALRRSRTADLGVGQRAAAS